MTHVIADQFKATGNRFSQPVFVQIGKGMIAISACDLQVIRKSMFREQVKLFLRYFSQDIDNIDRSLLRPFCLVYGLGRCTGTKQCPIEGATHFLLRLRLYKPRDLVLIIMPIH